MKIAEVSERYGIALDTLRYYECIGLIPPVTRNESSIRNCNELELQRVEFSKCMRKAWLPVEALVDSIGLVQQGDRTIEARREILKEQQALRVTRMKEMQITLDILDHNIEVYDQAVLKNEKQILQTEE